MAKNTNAWWSDSERGRPPASMLGLHRQPRAFGQPAPSDYRGQEGDVLRW